MRHFQLFVATILLLAGFGFSSKKGQAVLWLFDYQLPIYDSKLLPAPSSRDEYHQVGPGESWSQIAEKYGISKDRMKQFRERNNSIIYLSQGEWICIPFELRESP